MIDDNQETISIDGIRNRRIVFVSDAVCGRNGVGTYYQDLVAHLKRYLAYVELIAPSVDAPQPHQNFSFPIPGDSTQRMYWPKRGRLARMLREANPDAVVFPAIGPYTYFGVQEVRRMRRPIWIVQHTDFGRLARLYFHPLVAAVSRPIVQGLTGAVLRCANSIATVNAETAEVLRRNGFDGVRVLATPVAKEFFDTPTRPIRRAVRRVLFLGRLAKEKNASQVVAAARELPGIQFAIAGDGPLRKRIENECCGVDNLAYCGWLNRQQVIELIDDSDLLVLPSSIESFGTVALEAMVRGRLVLVSRHCGIRSWPRLAECLFHCGEDELLSDAIRRIADLPTSQRIQFSQRARFAAISANASAVDDWLRMFRELEPQNAQRHGMRTVKFAS